MFNHLFDDELKKLLDKATSSLLMETDWPTILQLCDLICEDNTEAEYALTLIDEKLYSSNERTILHTLEILDSMVKNCGSFLHEELNTMDFCQTLYGLVTTTPYELVRQKILELIQAWCFAFKKNYFLRDIMTSIEADGYQFPPFSEPKTMYNVSTVLDWVNNDNVCQSSNENEDELNEEEQLMLALALSQAEEEANKKKSEKPIYGAVCESLLSLRIDDETFKQELDAKLQTLRTELTALQQNFESCSVRVSRNEIFEESYRIIMEMDSTDLRNGLTVEFENEEGIDCGGVAREWLHLLSKEMLNPQYGLFQYSQDEHYKFQINPNSGVNPEHLLYFLFVGRILGIAVFHRYQIEGRFTLAFYKQLLNKPITLQDIKNVDPELHRNLTWMLENPIDGVIDTTFIVEDNSFGEVKVHELKPGGASIPVREHNKEEYVQLYVSSRFMRDIEQQFLALQKGFNELIPSDLLSSFNECELELVISGTRSINIADWRSNTRFYNCTRQTPIVQWFWRVVESYSEEMRAQLLQFVTGSSTVPLEGFKALQGSDRNGEPQLFTINCVGGSSQDLPVSHTCFNCIDIPPYSSYEMLADKLTKAVKETSGFGLA